MNQYSLNGTWQMRKAGTEAWISSEVLLHGENDIQVDSFSAKDVLTLDLSAELASVTDRRSKYLSYRFAEGGKVVSSDSSLFVMPKHFQFRE